MTQKEIYQIIENIKKNIGKVIIGNEMVIDYLLSAFLANGHVLMEDLPGTGKTMLAKALAASIHGDFHRIQFTPDLMPADVTGISIFKPNLQEFEFQPGPVFTNILLADELNRATPRTQSSLLECMEEKQVTTDGITRTLEQPFFLIATENPIEATGTYPLPEAQLDRFTMRLSMQPLNHEQQLAVIHRFLEHNPLEELSFVCEKDAIPKMQQEVKKITVHNSIREYIITLIEATANHNSLAYGANARCALQFVRTCQSLALIRGRAFVTPDDVKELWIPCLAHRLTALHTNRGVNIQQILEEILASTTVPTEDWN